MRTDCPSYVIYPKVSCRTHNLCIYFESPVSVLVIVYDGYLIIKKVFPVRCVPPNLNPDFKLFRKEMNRNDSAPKMGFPALLPKNNHPTSPFPLPQCPSFPTGPGVCREVSIFPFALSTNFETFGCPCSPLLGFQRLRNPHYSKKKKTAAVRLVYCSIN